MKRIFTLGIAAVLILMIAAAPALAAPQIQDLTSPTHPSQGYPYYDRNVTLTWGASPGPMGSYATSGDALGLTVDSGRAYVAADYGGLQVIDVGSPTDPAFVSSCCGDWWRAWDVAVSGSYAYVAYWNGLQIVDVTDPAAPTPLGSCGTPDWGMDVVLAGSYAYVPADTQGLQIIDVTDPVNPFVAGAYYTGGNARGVAVAGDYAFVANGWDGLKVIDVSDPTDPTLQATLYTSGFAHQVTVLGSYAYVAAEWGGLQVVDVSDPQAPELVGMCATPDAAIAVVVAGDRAFVAEGNAGVQEIDITDPASPMITRSFGTPGYARGLAFDGQYVYVADQEGGLQIIDPANTSAGFGYSYTLDQDYAGEPDDTADAVDDPGAPSISYSGLENGSWYFHVRAMDEAGDWGPTATFQITIDHTPKIENLWSPTNPWWTWSTCNDPTFSWNSAPPEAGTCDFSYSLDGDYWGEPDTVVDPVSDPANPSASFTDVADGQSYFHVRARDSEGTWGPTATYELFIDATGPVTMAISYKTAKNGTIWLQYSVSDNVSSECYVTIDIRTSAGKLVKTMDLGWKQCNVAFTAVVPGTLKKGSYRYTVHATDWLGNPESRAGTASFVVR
jgi:hypothetical protein